MISHVLMALGGVGIFLFGMIVLTDGLKALTGNTLRLALARYTKTPASGVATGAISTAIIQSSSATTVTAVGFVGAGLLTFKQALGIILGANIGTTITGWLVLLIGFKLQLGLITMPLVFIGILMRLFGAGHVRNAGWAMAGFGLLFVGIETMQQGMAAFEGFVTPASFPADSLWGRFELVLIGIAITIVTQSSSAGVAATLVALSVGTISFPQGAAMVIGMDVGTTFTAVLATLGGSVSMRQTAFSHVIYNLFAATMAFCTLGLYITALDTWVDGGSAGHAQMAVVGFHTLFNTVGVLIVLPFVGSFARLVTRLFPEQAPWFERGLDKGLLKEPAVAAGTLVEVTKRIVREQITVLELLLNAKTRQQVNSRKLDEIARAISAVEEFAAALRQAHIVGVSGAIQESIIHILDHQRRLAHRFTQEERIAILENDDRLRQLSISMAETLHLFLEDGDPEQATYELDKMRRFMRLQRRAYRAETMHNVVENGLGQADLLLRLDAVRWLQRVSYHVWRISAHLAAMQGGTVAVEKSEE